MTKKIFLSILLLSTLFITFAENTYDSYVSAEIDVTGNEDKKGQNLKASAFYLGQFSLDNSFSARGQFLVETEEIFKNGVFQHTPAFFTIKELSTSYRFLTGNINHYISFFLGEFDSFGSDSFAKKYFGTQRYVPSIRRIKFSAPIRPDTKIKLDLAHNTEKQSISFTMADAEVEGKTYSSGSFSVLYN